MLDFDTWFLTLDFDDLMTLGELALRTNKRTDNGNPRVALRLITLASWFTLIYPV